MYKFDVTVIGAGIVGLAIAAEYSKKNCLVIDRQESFGREASSRNSEVLHAGIYYPTGSLKARFCVEGRRLTSKICEKRNIKCKK